MTFNHGRYEASLSLVGGMGFAMSWEVEWFDEETGNVSYWYGSREECIAEARLDEPSNPEWVPYRGWTESV